MKIEELINQAKTGNQKAFNKLYEMYHKLIRYINLLATTTPRLVQSIIPIKIEAKNIRTNK